MSKFGRTLSHDLEAFGLRWARRVANAVRSAAPRKPHRGGRKGPIGGSFYNRIRSRDFVKRKPWGVVFQFFKLGHTFLFFVEGTKKQKARPVPLAPSEAEVRGVVERSAHDYFSKRNDREFRR